MTTKDDFSEDEWRIVAMSPFSAGMAVTMADLTLVSAYKEAMALAGKLADSKDAYRDNELLTAVLSQSYESQKQPARKRRSPAEMMSDALAEVARAAALVDSRAPKAEAAEFKAFLYEVAEQVARASGEGWFGLGKKVSGRETECLAELKEILGR